MTAIYNLSTNTIYLFAEDYTLNKIYIDINTPSALSYDSVNNTYILNAKIESSGLANLSILNTTLLINSTVDDEYYLQVGKILNIDNSIIKSVNGKRFYIWGARKVTTSGWYGTINNSIIDGGFIVFFTAKMYATPTGSPYVRVLNTTIKNVDMTGITQIIPDTSTEIWSPLSLNQRLSPLCIPFAAGTNALVQNVTFDNVIANGIASYGASLYGGVITLTSDAINIKLKNIRIINSTTYAKGAIYTRGAINNFTMDNIIIENFNGRALDFKEGHVGVGKSNYYKDVTIKNSGSCAICLYQNMFASDPNNPSGARLENLIINGGINKTIDTLIRMDYINTVYLWGFNIKLENANKVFLLRNNVYFFTNALVQNFTTKYDYMYDHGEVNWYEILDVKVVDINNKPITGAIIEIIPDTIAPQPNSVDKWFNPKTSTITDSTGHTPLPTDETGMIALLRQRDYSSGSQSTTYSYSIKASYMDLTNTVTNVVPSTLWYRPNIISSMNTVIIQIPIDIGCPQPICEFNITQV